MPDEEEVERRIELIELKGMMAHNNEITERLERAILGNNGDPGLLTKHAVMEVKVKKLESFKWWDRGLSVMSGFAGGIAAVFGKAFLK